MFLYVVTNLTEADRNPSHAPLTKAVRAAKAQLTEEGIVFKQGSRNKFLMRMGYLLNAYGVPMDDATDWAIGKCKYNGERGYLVVERSGEEIQASRKIAGNELSES